MKNVLVITALISFAALISAKPANDFVEIEKQRLVKFPEDPYQYQTSQQTEETKRILSEIDKINRAFGYVKKTEARIPSILDSSQYLYPKPAYHPLNFGYHDDGDKLEASIRSLRLMRDISRPKYEIAEIFQIPLLEFPGTARKIKSVDKSNLYAIPLQLASSYNNRQANANLEHYYEYSTQEASDPNQYQLFLVPNKVESRHKKSDKKTAPSWHKLDVSSPSNAMADKQRTKSKDTRTKGFYPGTSTARSSVSPNTVKSPLSFFNPFQISPSVRPEHVKAPAPTQAPVTAKPVAPTPQPAVNENIGAIDYDIQSSEESTEETGSEKTIFASLKKQIASVQENEKEAIKTGGIIIKRLKVRKGGIAIAGPGGVATAGSGGTAIVGPGGYALTHPRSLTIAGPGAKVYSLPESTDLKEALLRTEHGKSLPFEGRIVATGPAIYYNNTDEEEYRV